MEQVPAKSVWWRLFALIISLLLVLIALRSHWSEGLGANWATIRGVYWLLAPIGLVGFAFGFRLFPLSFWRVYAILFTTEIVIRSMKVAWVPFARLAGWPEQSRHGTFTILLMLLFIALTCIALLRLGALIGEESRA
jgi:hypothetical protein